MMALGNGKIRPTAAQVEEMARHVGQPIADWQRNVYETHSPRRGLSSSDECMEMIAKSLERQTTLMERQCMVEERSLHTMNSILDKQNEIVKQLTADTRIAELKAHKWEEHAIRLQGELDEARRG